ncbi:MAG: hypothetical protein LBK95_10190 [Bifidobacteriaceae bacterium]|jgi:hypothetical protein|nr:hypothetical protein [Bifidobacteriaceae bacterium]
MRKIVAVVAAACAAMLAAGCAGDPDAAEQTAEQTPTVESPTPPAPAEPSVEPSEAPEIEALKDGEIAVDLVLEDPETGNSVKVISYIPSVPMPEGWAAEFAATAEGSSLLLARVEFSVAAEPEFQNGLADGDVKLFGTGAEGAYGADSASSILYDYLAQEYPPVQTTASGGTSTGWLAWRVGPADGAAPFRLVLPRKDGAVDATGNTLPAAEFEVELPAA